MNEKLKEKLEYILDFYAIDTDRDAIGHDLLELIEDAYSQGWSDAKDDSYEEDYLKDDGDWSEV